MADPDAPNSQTPILSLSLSPLDLCVRVCEKERFTESNIIITFLPNGDSGLGKLSKDRLCSKHSIHPGGYMYSYI